MFVLKALRILKNKTQINNTVTVCPCFLWVTQTFSQFTMKWISTNEIAPIKTCWQWDLRTYNAGYTEDELLSMISSEWRQKSQRANEAKTFDVSSTFSVFWIWWTSPLRVNYVDSWWKSFDFDSSCLSTRKEAQCHITDDTLTLQVEHLVLFEVTIATTTQQDRMSIMLIRVHLWILLSKQPSNFIVHITQEEWDRKW